MTYPYSHKAPADMYNKEYLYPPTTCGWRGQGIVLQRLCQGAVDSHSTTAAEFERSASNLSGASTPPATPMDSSGHDCNNHVSSFYKAMAKDIRRKRERHIAEVADKRAHMHLPVVDRKASCLAATTNASRSSQRDDRPVRGVVKLQADPSSTGPALSVLLVVGKGTLSVQELTGDFQQLLCLQLRHLIVKLVPGHDNMLRITVRAPRQRLMDANDEAISESILVVLPDLSMRDRWLEALSDMDVVIKDWHPAANTDAARTCRYGLRSYLNGALPPIRWIA